jgi:hypothetical protein
MTSKTTAIRDYVSALKKIVRGSKHFGSQVIYESCLLRFGCYLASVQQQIKQNPFLELCRSRKWNGGTATFHWRGSVG